MTAGPENYSYEELEFAKNGSAVDPGQATKVGNLADTVTDLIVMSHGWNNDMDEARSLYHDIAASFDAVRAQNSVDLGGRTLGIVGILWPSKRFADAELIPGGAAGIAVADPTLSADLRSMSDAFSSDDAETTLHQAAALTDELDDSPTAQRKYADLLRSLVDRQHAEPADAPDEFFSMDGADLMARLQKAVLTVMTQDIASVERGGNAQAVGLDAVPAAGGDTGAAAGLGSALTHIWSQGRALLNFVTYYEMKTRAGTIGAKSVAPVLHQQVAGRTRLHLLGHSFGARLVTAAADKLPSPGRVTSMSLLQAAFSHNSFAKDWAPGKDGGFRDMIDAGRVDGSLIVTHTRNDKAVGIAYAIASSIAGQDASAIGDASSPYGGLGSNGAQHTPEATDQQALQDVAATYTFDRGKIYNLLADRFIAGHSDVRNVQVANAVLQVVTAIPR
jgi:hypothetical protein